jgi:hypothetical protein
MGTLFHYVYKLSDCDYAVGFFVPVNESVFEHAKLLTLPLMVCWLIDAIICAIFHDGGHHLIAGTVAVYSSVGFMLLVYFAVSVCAGWEDMYFNIGLFCVSVFLAQGVGLVCLRQITRASLPTLVIAMVFLVGMCMCHILITELPPKEPSWMFEDHLGFYGRPLICNDTTALIQTTSIPTTTSIPQITSPPPGTTTSTTDITSFPQITTSIPPTDITSFPQITSPTPNY